MKELFAFCLLFLLSLSYCLKDESSELSHPYLHVCLCSQEEKDWQWRQATEYLSAVTELNYMTQIVIMLYEDNDKVP